MHLLLMGCSILHSTPKNHPCPILLECHDGAWQTFRFLFVMAILVFARKQAWQSQGHP